MLLPAVCVADPGVDNDVLRRRGPHARLQRARPRRRRHRDAEVHAGVHVTKRGHGERRRDQGVGRDPTKGKLISPS